MVDGNASFTDVQAEVNESLHLNSTILGCPEISTADFKLMEDMAYWLEGVIQTVVAFGGILGNVASCYILSRREMRNSFNLLLVMLSVYDTFYLLFAILDSCRKFFENLTSDVHIILFPHFLYPLHHTALAGSIFMTVSIAFERYTAVHYPLDYNKSVNTAEAMRCRLLKYFIPVLVMSLVFNIPKFLECFVSWEQTNSTIIHPYNETANLTVIETEWHPEIQITHMRVNEYYSIFNTYSRLIVLGLIPLALISFFNYKIFKDIRERQMRKANAANSLPNAKGSVNNATVVTNTNIARPTTVHATIEKSNSQSNDPKNSMSGSNQQNGKFVDSNAAGEERIPMKTILRMEVMQSENSTGNGTMEETSQIKSITKNNIEQGSSTNGHNGCSQNHGQISVNELNSGGDDGTIALIQSNSSYQSDNLVHPDVENGKVKGSWNDIKRKMTMKKTVKIFKQTPSEKEKKKQKEDNLGVVFMGIISIFIVTNLPRVILDIHEAATIRMAQECADAGKEQFALWSMLCLSVAHFLLVLNSSINVVIYCLTSSQFRTELVKIFDLFAYRMGCRKRRRHGLGGTRNGR